VGGVFFCGRLLERLGIPHIGNMTRDPLQGIRLKHDRAHDQLAYLDAGVRAFVESKPCTFRIEFDADRGELKIYVRELVAPPPIWGVLIGEVVHNLRSALDHLVWELVIHNTGAPPRATKSGFPIFNTEAGYDAKNHAPVLVQGVAADTAALIKSLNPFSTGEGAKSPLWLLQKLSNFDKHRTLHLTSTLLRGANFSLPPLKPMVRITGYQVARAGPVKDGAEIARFSLVGPPGSPFMAEDQMRVEVKVSGGVAFDPGCDEVSGKDVMETLTLIGIRASETIKRVSREGLGLEF
jgi:hypothetical protein